MSASPSSEEQNRLGWLGRLHPEFFLLGLLGAVAVTWPLVLHFTDHIPGSELVGSYSHVWKAWWTGQALLSEHTNPAFSPLLNYPQGLDVGYHMAGFGNEILALPVTWLLGPVAGYNTIVLMALATGCWAAALVGTWSGLGRVPAALVGLAWSLAPHHLGFLMGGAIENLPSPWFPLLFLAILWLLGVRPRPENGSTPAPPQPRTRAQTALAVGAVGLFLFLATMVSWVSGGILVAYSGLVLLGALALRRKRALRGVLLAGLGLALGAIAVLVVSKLLLPTAGSADLKPITLITSDNLEFIWMSYKRQLMEDTVFRSRTLWLNHHVLITLGALALVGLSSPRGRLWFLLAVPFLIDMVLPNSLTQVVTLEAPEESSMVFTAMAAVLAEPCRRLFPMHLMLALAAGHGLSWLTHRLRSHPEARGLPWIALAMWSAEWLFIGPVEVPVSTFHADAPQYIEDLEVAGEGAVIDLPLMVELERATLPDEPLIKAVRSKYMFYQTHHGRPIITSVGSRLAYDPEDIPVFDPLLDWAVREGTRRQSRLHDLQDWDASTLRQAGFRWVVVHPMQDQFFTSRRLGHKLEPLLGEPRVYEDGVYVFDLGALSAEAAR